jgi:2-polyprenyl-3-methyl-5-hydroxy-6-metoxy-1,4-benzoquinol methylase
MDKHEVSERYKGEEGKKYAKVKHDDGYHVGYELNFEYFEPYIGRESRVLDFGCGNGGMLNIIRRNVEVAHGVEVNEHSAKVARSNGMKVYGSIGDLPDENEYDVIVSNHVLEHVRNPPGTIEGLKDYIRSGGMLCLKVPIEDWRAKDQKSWEGGDINHHLQTWTPKLMGNTLCEAGYSVEEIKTVTSAWHKKLFPLVGTGMGKFAFWALAVLKKRRQLFDLGRVD